MRLTQRAENIILPIAAVVIALLIGAVLIWLNGSNPWTAYTALDRRRARQQGRHRPDAGPGHAGHAHRPRRHRRHEGRPVQHRRPGPAAVRRRRSRPGSATGSPTCRPIAHVPLGLLVGGIMGMLPAALAGFLKAYRGAHEVITTIMLNVILVNMTEYLVGARGPFHDPEGGAISRTPAIQAVGPHRDGLGAADRLLPGRSPPSSSSGSCSRRTTVGFRITTVGQNKNAALYGGISAARITVLAMAISGFLAGFGGAIETQGVFYRYEAGFNVGLGFDGITVALLARVQPLLAIPAALLLGIMRAGQTNMAFEADVPQEIIDVILAMILLLVCAPIVVRWLLRLRRPKDEGAAIQLTSGWGG